jgi:hypothetical protein
LNTGIAVLGAESGKIETVGYDTLIHFIRRERLDRLTGDLLEISDSPGDGTAMLARLARVTGKRLWVLNRFSGPNQEQAFRAATRPWADCIRVIKEDSPETWLPDGTRLSFGFSDIHASARSCQGDFQRIWTCLAPEGWAGFHNYGDAFPEVTAALDSMLRKYGVEIETVETMEERSMLFVKKRASTRNPTAKDAQS